MVPSRCENCGRKLKGDGPLCALCTKVAETKARAELGREANPIVERVQAAADRKVERTELIAERKLKFLTELLANGGHVQQACRSVGVSETCMREYAADDPDFQLAWDTVQDTNVERLEAEADRRAMGYEVHEPLSFRGELTGDVKVTTQVSDTLLMFRLKALRPEKYRDGPGINKNGPQLSEEELDAALGKMIARRAAKQGAHTIIEAEATQ